MSYPSLDISPYFVGEDVQIVNCNELQSLEQVTSSMNTQNKTVLKVNKCPVTIIDSLLQSSIKNCDIISSAMIQPIESNAVNNTVLTLNIQNARLSSLVNFNFLMLTSLSLPNNNLTSLQGLGVMTQLTFINVQFNKIISIGELLVLQNLKQLQKLIIYNNPVVNSQFFEPTIHQMKHTNTQFNWISAYDDETQNDFTVMEEDTDTYFGEINHETVLTDKQLQLNDLQAQIKELQQQYMQKIREHLKVTEEDILKAQTIPPPDQLLVESKKAGDQEEQNDNVKDTNENVKETEPKPQNDQSTLEDGPVLPSKSLAQALDLSASAKDMGSLRVKPLAKNPSSVKQNDENENPEAENERKNFKPVISDKTD
ncbi:Leucine-rich_repeat domain superfamily [Hexamita inflata]|uniref:Leucine-rich repeat domain superfamily n=1 Tax=Hexamita inflata TaxID=28002 RepID=A0AA86RFF9_9EUKA|nr:Leucine-rich repeat domain superfamily [Hexamita inflata]